MLLGRPPLLLPPSGGERPSHVAREVGGDAAFSPLRRGTGAGAAEDAKRGEHQAVGGRVVEMDDECGADAGGEGREEGGAGDEGVRGEESVERVR